MITRPATAVSRHSVGYSGDAFAYSLPGGFAKALVSPPRSNDVARKQNAITERDVERTLVVTDVACDLPADWLQQMQVTVLPNRLRFDSRNRSDTGDATLANDFFRRDLDGVGADAQALPLSASGTQEFIYDRLHAGTDFVLEVSLASHRGNGYLNSLTAAQNLMLQHGRARRQSGVQRPFKMWVVDSTTALNGQAVLVAESVRALHDGTTMPRVVQHIDALRRHVRVITIPHNVSFFYRHNRVEGEAAVNWLSIGMGKVLDRTPIMRAHGGTLAVAAQTRSHDDAVARALGSVTQHVRAGLLAPCVCMSYAGNVVEVRQRPAFTALEDACIRHGVALHLGTMSMTNAIELGRNALSIAFAAEGLML